MSGLDGTDILLFLLFLGALAVGWWLGSRRPPFLRRAAVNAYKGTPSRDYFIGLNYLLNDEPDDAIDIFTDFLEVNSSTLETYMALGKLLRRRGKVDRSIAVYQELLGKGGFSRAQLNDVKLNLVQSYVAAGLFDRAEHILEELRQEKGNVRIRALVHAANIAQQERDWPKGVEALTELIRYCAPDQRAGYQFLASHYYAELALEELNNDRYARAREILVQAAAMDRGNPRVSMMRGQLEAACGNHREAIKHFLKVKKQNPVFMTDVFDALLACYRQAGKEKGLKKFVHACMAEDNGTSVLVGLADYLREEEGIDKAREFLLARLDRKSSLRLLQALLALEPESDESKNREMALFRNVLDKYLENQPQYRCDNCGFELKSLYWQCPSCAEWGTIAHVQGMLGE